MILLSIFNILHRTYFSFVQGYLSRYSKNTFVFWILVTFNIATIILWGRQEIKIYIYNIPFIWIFGYLCLTILMIFNLFFKKNKVIHEKQKKSSGILTLLIITLLYMGLLMLILLMALVDLRSIYYLLKDILSWMIA